MGAVLAALVLIAVVVLLVRWAWTLQQQPPGAAGLPARDRARRARALEAARWTTAHDEVEGTTRVLLRRSCVGPDGLPEVLEERVFETFPAKDPLWEARFTEAMSNARFRCRYLNAEEGHPG
ncbi:hypothetical protein [Modestobacter versicolor]|uniref:Uncharacterized protein n=1 Tax=Modestobacter versicolor TaxID=429133 RepID=A0A323VFD0_9ACTN|nr:hypothetical protein [Modestobacter versicolor]MBB3676633.1 hypothetical protein [Modestobacter versicolor]PZA23321.1 hypothetical protein DMO24_00485 [Modestobacter versicolor]